jgi:hypothetical protein
MNLSIIPPQSIVAMKSMKSGVHEVSVGDDSISQMESHTQASAFSYFMFTELVLVSLASIVSA